MLFKDITILNEDMEIEEHRYVSITGDHISYIGNEPPAESHDREIDGRGRLLMSGFFNAHAHSPMTLMRGYGENMALQDWLTKKIFPFEDKLYPQAVYWATMLAMAESLKFGIVSSSDMYYFCEDMAKAVIDSGAKDNISRSVVNPAGIRPESLESFREMKDFYREFHGAAEGRIKVDMSLHAEYTSDLATAEALADHARSLGDVNMQVHVSETATEHRECLERHGLTPAAYLEKAGIFDVPTVAAHCVWSTEEDLDIFRKKGVTVAANPVSNMKLASGFCPIDKLLKAGVNVALGTDSVASNNNLNMLEEIKTFALIHKGVSGDPTLVTPAEALYAATRAGALAQGREDCGLLKEGYKADIVAVDIDNIYMRPAHNQLNNLVYSACGSDVAMTMVDGRILYDRGEFPHLDIEKLVYHTDESCQRILTELKAEKV